MQWTVRPYTPADEAEWDRFVMHESGNGTFLQTRNFLNYHPAGRFTDASLMVYNEHGGLGAVVPAALRLDGATRIFRSHPGSTFGGPVLRSTYNSAAKSIGILQAVEDYIATRYDAGGISARRPTCSNGIEKRRAAIRLHLSGLHPADRAEHLGAGGGPHAGNTAGVLPPEQKSRM